MNDALARGLVRSGDLNNWLERRSHSLEIVEAEIDRRAQRSAERRSMSAALGGVGFVDPIVPVLVPAPVVVLDPYVPMSPVGEMMEEVRVTEYSFFSISI